MKSQPFDTILGKIEFDDKGDVKAVGLRHLDDQGRQISGVPDSP